MQWSFRGWSFGVASSVAPSLAAIGEQESRTLSRSGRNIMSKEI